MVLDWPHSVNKVSIGGWESLSRSRLVWPKLQMQSMDLDDIDDRVEGRV